MLSTWGVGNDCCRWERVGCDSGRVVSLHLGQTIREENYFDHTDIGPFQDEYYNKAIVYKNYCLVGVEVNSCLGELENLKYLDLSGNDFQKSQIPKFIGSLTQLRYLNLSDACLRGSIPHQIGNLSNLKVLDLGFSSNDLMIDDMAWISSLPKLEHLDLSGVDLSEAQNLDNLFYMTALSKLSLSGCGLSLAQIGTNHLNSSRELATIKHLDLSGNYFTGKLSSIFLNMRLLEFLDISQIDLGMAWNFESFLSMIPSILELRLSNCNLNLAHANLNFSTHSKIQHLDLSGNYFTGQLSRIFQNMTSLEFLDISQIDLGKAWNFESFLSMIPSILELRLSSCNLNFAHTNLNFSTHSKIQHLDLSGNNIVGKFPIVLTNMSSLMSLDLSQNGLNSPIPTMPNLLKLDISENNLGQIENVGIWRQCHLKELIVSYNNLEGEMIGPSTNLSECSQMGLEILYLDNNALNCSIPESLGRLTNLKVLDIGLNNLRGSIPKALGRLKALQGLYLSNNYLTGHIPNFHGQLTTLHLAYNQLSGSIPESLGRSTALIEIMLESNGITGSIPVSLGRHTSLRMLSVASNLLNGTIPASLGQLTKLYLFDISNNSLQGVVTEDHFASLSMLKYLNADYNYNLLFNISHEWKPPFQLILVRLCSCKIENGFPQWLRTQRKLEELVLSNASISGFLPTWLRLLPIIRTLDLSHNKLTGHLMNLPSLYELEFRSTLVLEDNLLTGFIPRCLCARKDLQILDLSRNRLTGKIPNCLWNLSLDMLLLSSNRLSGVIPSFLGHMDPSLEWLQLNDNNFSGELPRDSRYFNYLTVFDLGENKISGKIPEWIGENITSLSALRLHTNNFTGKIPYSLCKCQNLQILDIAYNNITGSIPHCFKEFGGMKETLDVSYMTLFDYGSVKQMLKGLELNYTKNVYLLVSIDLSSNKLAGEIPEALTTLDALVGLNLSHNNFSGVIPKKIGNIKYLSSLDLSSNKLMGLIPPSMATLNFLSYLNLSHNNLSGQIPTGNQLQTLTDPSIYSDNPYLCGARLPKECSPHENPPITTKKNKNESANEPRKVWFYLDIAYGFATGFWGIIGVLLLTKQWRRKLFMVCEEIIDNIHVAVMLIELKLRRGREAA